MTDDWPCLEVRAMAAGGGKPRCGADIDVFEGLWLRGADRIGLRPVS